MSLHSYDATTKTLTRIAGSTPPVFGYTPVGTVISVMATEAPEFYLKCDGTVYNIADYPELAQHFENQFGSANNFGGDGTTTFAVPDLRGEFLRGTGTNSHENQGSGENVGEHQDGTEIPIDGANENAAVIYGSAKSGGFYAQNADHTENVLGRSVASTRDIVGAGVLATSRPTNTSVLYCIAYQNIHISLDDNRPVQAAMDRWLRFDPENKKGLIIKAGTSILKSNKHYKTFNHDTKVDFSSTITGSDNGKDFFVYLLDDDSVIASNSKLTVGVEIGRFHTLCADAGSSLTMIMPASPSSGINTAMYVQVKPYRIEIDPDFYLFYQKKVTAVSAGTPYDVITCEHPLKGYVAGDILPESVFCKTFYPETLVDDAMVYDKTTDLCVDVYLQSGTGFNTRSAFNATHTVNRQQVNHLRDLQTVGKRLLSDPEFFSIALGSNECTVIQGASDKTTVGGHVDTAGRRMISAIGCEECCGYIWQWLNDISPVGGANWNGYDGRNSFGQTYGTIPYGLLAGGYWANSSFCGSMSRSGSDPRSTVNVFLGGRGCIEVTKSANAPKSEPNAQDIYSLEERVVGRWINGKPLYQKTITFISQSSAGNKYIDVSDLNSDTLMIDHSHSFLIAGDNVYFPVNWGDTANYLMCAPISETNNKSIQFRITTNGAWTLAFNKPVYVTIQYTKTTD